MGALTSLFNRPLPSAMAAVALSTGLLLGGTARADDKTAASATLAPELKPKVDAAASKAVEYFRTMQNEDGSFGEGNQITGVTALVVTGLLGNANVTADDPMVAKGLKYLESKLHEDGGIYDDPRQKNYPTAIAVLAFAKANKDGRYKELLDKAAKFLKQEQWDESEGITPDNDRYGGAGYGGKSRPDLSNTAFLLEALKASGLPESDPAYKRAAIFVTRCQNLSGEGANDLPFAAKIDDGGFYYTPVDAPKDGPGLRSYGSMTYAGLKSFIYAGLDKNDPRVQAALDWIRKNYSLTENPGMGDQGLYYYYHTFAKALAAADLEEITANDGSPHNWRNELATVLVTTQLPDGSWVNKNPRWMESDPRLVTAFVLMTIDELEPEKKAN